MQHSFDLEKPLFHFSSAGNKLPFTIRDSVTGVAVFGSSGSGKSSAVGAFLAKHLLTEKYGGCVLMSKNTDKADWIEYARATNRLNDLSLIWTSSDLENKRQMQKTLFPDGIYYDVEKHEYLTTKTNEFIHLASCITKSCTEKENGNFQDFLENSRSVVLTGIEPVSKV